MFYETSLGTGTSTETWVTPVPPAVFEKLKMDHRKKGNLKLGSNTGLGISHFQRG